MSTNKGLREVVEQAKQLGLTVDDIVNGKHVKLYLTTPVGKKILTISRSASCHHADANNASLLKRWAKGQP